MSQPPLFDPIARLNRHRRVHQDALFLHDIALSDIQERLSEVNRPFTNAHLFGSQPKRWAQSLGIEFSNIPANETLNFPNPPYDLIVHSMALHGLSDPVGQLIQCRNALRADGFFLACFLGGTTLSTLRHVLLSAEAEVTGGAAPRISPMIDIRDAGALLSRAGFALPVADGFVQNVSYKDIYHLCGDLRAMGETNILSDRSKSFSKRQIFEAANKMYPKNSGGGINAEFELIFISGWAPHPDQQQPLRPGSAKVRLLDALDPKKSSSNL